MKLIKYKVDELIVNNMRVVDNNYILLETEEDITTFKNITDYKVGKDINYILYRLLMSSLSFEVQESPAQFEMCRLCQRTQEQIITYYMTNGYSLEDSINWYKRNILENISSAAIVCKNKISSENVFWTILEYLPLTEAGRFAIETHVLQSMYKSQAWLGTVFGDGEGLYDFIHDLGSYSGKGLSTYTLNNGKILGDFIGVLDNLLFNFSS